MKIIESYKDINLSIKSKKKLYEAMHEQKDIQFINNLIPKGKSVWIDSFGDTFNPNIVAFEKDEWKGIFEPTVLVKYYNDINSPTLVQAINKYINPTSIVLYESNEFKYLTVEEVYKKITYLKESFNCKLLIYLDLKFIDFNKLKYSNKSVIECLEQNIITHTIDRFKYVMEIN